jgi:hypothetical protein
LDSIRVVPVELTHSKIVVVRDERVMFDRDLAELYGVETKQLKRAVRRNLDRFPPDFMFELTRKDLNDLRCHFGTSSWGGTRYAPMVFTEQGVAMLSSVLNSKRAIEVNILIMRAFVKLRQLTASHKDLLRKVEEMERKYDHQFRVVFEAIKQLMAPHEPSKKRIGFEVKEPKAGYVRR